MDHHCVWTANCVSHITIPHFVRFLFYAVVSMAYLEYFLCQRISIIWQQRTLPSYLGPSVLKIAHVFILITINSFVLFALILLLGRTIWCLSVNTWTIEGWEIERHHTLLRRARALGGYLDAPDGSRIQIQHQEFPWDVGILTNICQGMGTRNPLAWFWPFSQSPSVASGLSFEHNEIDDPSKPWPPPDPDRLFKVERKPLVGDGFTKSWDINDFKKRQAADMARHANADGEHVVRRRPFRERMEGPGRHRSDDGADYYDNGEYSDVDSEEEDGDDLSDDARGGGGDGEEAWRNKEGERLADFGVDEMADFYDEDDLPLAELIRRKKGGVATS
ncbi:related to Palmitoyltransferase pfa4 [Ramularia collo-cygni]|uniref:Palmitoyltransferase n=1 Tax=Ramularia collo-cygni TaxID=112498 RepID=A0A2D3USG6_9PEZI|nr:related to Palmitoyltransferase pfa4 [Ramularia collo-cygni]CZT17738.1 related to Palmitoyltransferase pfa4 [Ramularia collo-cygni]